MSDPVDRRSDEYQPPPSWRHRYQAQAEGGPEWRAWTWASTGHPVPWFGVLIVVLGVGLLIEQLIPELSLGSLIILAMGGALAVAWLAARSTAAMVPALVLVAWGLSRIGSELGYLSGDGWSLLFVGVALLVAWAIGRAQGTRRDWALWLGLILGLIGLADAADTLPFALDAAVIIPLALILLGLWLIWRRRFSVG
ncbi:hypothetical protein BH24CHL9_BH24CHL9_05650 [soil metagenome]